MAAKASHRITSRGLAAFTAVLLALCAHSALAADVGETYVVQPGDTLTIIATGYGVSVSDLIQLNELDDPDSLIVGATLTLPAGATDTRSTTARGGARPELSGSSGSSIAPPSAPSSPITSPTVTASPSATASPTVTVTPSPATRNAQMAPVPSTGQSTMYIVQNQDTLATIARRYGVTVDDIMMANHLTPADRITVGLALRIEPGAASRAALAASSSSASTGTASNAAVTVSTTSTVTTTASTSAARPATTTGTATPTPTPARTGASTSNVVNVAMQYRGAPYVYAGMGPSGFDCSGFAYFVYRQAGTPISRDIFDQYDAGTHPVRADLQPGDLVFFADTYMAGLSHVGIFIGNQQFIHAADEDSGVSISYLNSDYWAGHWYGATRVAPQS